MARTRSQTLDAVYHPRRRGLSGPVRILLAGLGVAGLAGLAAAAFGPRRYVPRIILPLRDKASAALAPQAEKLWEEFRETLESVKSEAMRARLLYGLHAWLARFRHS